MVIVMMVKMLVGIGGDGGGWWLVVGILTLASSLDQMEPCWSVGWDFGNEKPIRT